MAEHSLIACRHCPIAAGILGGTKLALCRTREFRRRLTELAEMNGLQAERHAHERTAALKDDGCRVDSKI